MTWTEIKTAVEAAGIEDTTEIAEIRCELHGGTKTFQVIHIGHGLKLQESIDERQAHVASGGCAC
jgi:hypothetical protein